MEYVLAKSLVIEKIVGHKLTVDYISSNYDDIMPDSQIIDVNKQDFDFLFQEKIEKIKQPEIVLSFLHKYEIKYYYDKMINHMIWKILSLEYLPSTLIPEIIDYIVSYNNDFTTILNFLINKEKGNLEIKDFLFSMSLLTLGLSYFPKYDVNDYNKGEEIIIDAEYAVKYEIMDVIEYLFTTKKSPMFEICDYAILFDKIKVLYWAESVGYNFDNEALEFAVDCRQFELIKWFYARGCKFNDYICINATKKGYLEILNYAQDCGYEINKKECLAFASDPEVKLWLES